MIDKESTTETTPEEVEESDSENQATSENEKGEKTWEEKYNAVSYTHLTLPTIYSV